jgi:cytochrome b
MNRSEDLLVGMIGLILLPLIAWRIIWGVRTGRLALYRTYMTREESASKFNALLALHAVSFIAVVAMAADLLFNLGLRSGR